MAVSMFVTHGPFGKFGSELTSAFVKSVWIAISLPSPTGTAAAACSHLGATVSGNKVSHHRTFPVNWVVSTLMASTATFHLVVGRPPLLFIEHERSSTSSMFGATALGLELAAAASAAGNTRRRRDVADQPLPTVGVRGAGAVGKAHLRAAAERAGIAVAVRAAASVHDADSGH